MILMKTKKIPIKITCHFQGSNLFIIYKIYKSACNVIILEKEKRNFYTFYGCSTVLFIDLELCNSCEKKFCSVAERTKKTLCRLHAWKVLFTATSTVNHSQIFQDFISDHLQWFNSIKRESFPNFIVAMVLLWIISKFGSIFSKHML